MQNPFTPARAARQKTLVTRLTALLRQVGLVAKPRPGEAVSAPVLRLAEDLLFEAREFRPRGERRGLPAAAPDHAGLAVQLGQALAMLEVWSAENRDPGPSQPSAGGEGMDQLREKLARRIERHEAGIFEAGRRAGLAENHQTDHVLADAYPRIRSAD